MQKGQHVSLKTFIQIDTKLHPTPGGGGRENHNNDLHSKIQCIKIRYVYNEKKEYIIDVINRTMFRLQLVHTFTGFTHRDPLKKYNFIGKWLK